MPNLTPSPSISSWLKLLKKQNLLKYMIASILFPTKSISKKSKPPNKKIESDVNDKAVKK